MTRLVAADLDGTLLRSDGTISDRTREVLTRLQDDGIIVVFVTGRPLRWARWVFDDVGDHGMAIVSNGALVWNVTDDEPDLVRPVDIEAGIAACERIREAIPGTTFATESLSGISLEPGFVERYQLPEDTPRGELPEIFNDNVLKVLARHEELQPQEFWDQAAVAAGADLEIVWSSSTTLLEMSAGGVTKASTLELWARRHDIAGEDVIAFGDMPNDIAMLRWAGTSYAMANAHHTVRDAADHVAPHHEEDGVAQVLEDLVRQ